MAITSETLVNMRPEGTNLYWEVCNNAWKEKKVPEDWLIGMITPIYYIKMEMYETVIPTER